MDEANKETTMGDVKSSPALDLTVGRATNDQLEQTVAVWFKHEYEDGDGNASGPIYLELSTGHMVPLNKGESEWHSADLAEALATDLGVPVNWS